jgi:drug/metabolite transporter (DMT)-like permease
MNRIQALELTLLGAIWGASFLFQRVAAPEFGPLALVEVRVAIAAALLGAVAHSRSVWPSTRSHWRELFVLAAFNSAIPFVLFAYATLHLSAGFAAVLNATAPLFGVLVAFAWIGQRPRFLRVLGLIVGFAGVVVLITSKGSLGGAGWAVAAGLCAALGYGFSAHWTLLKLQRVHPLAIAAGSQVASSVLLLPFAIAYWPSAKPSMAGVASAAALGAVCTGLAYLIYFHLLPALGPTRTMTVTYLVPIFAMAWGALFLAEPITLGMSIGGAVILTGVALVACSNSQKSASAPETASADSPTVLGGATK